MAPLSLSAQRRLVGLGMAAAAVLTVGWVASPGLPVWWGPTASAATKEAGRELFEHEWSANDPLAGGDGLGPVYNAASCVACHFQGGVGGGGSVAHNAVNFEVLPRPADPRFLSGTIHTFSTEAGQKESLKLLRTQHPVVVAPPPPPPPPGHCGYSGPARLPDFDPVRTDAVQPTALFGAGWLDRVSDKAITHNYRARAVRGAAREFNLDFTNTVGGRVRTLAGGRVGKFGWKAQFATLGEFVAAACANELGLGTPDTPQAKPLAAAGPADIAPDLTKKQFRALLAFVDTLPRPVEVVPDGAAGQAAARGKELFGAVGCASCHVPDLGGVAGIYTDFQLHVLDDPRPAGGGDGYGSNPLPDFPRPDDVPGPDEWKTPALWGVADSAPYFHDGGCATLADAIRRHKGEGKSVLASYTALSAGDQSAVLAFLGTLKAPADAPPVRNLAVTRLAKR